MTDPSRRCLSVHLRELSVQARALDCVVEDAEYYDWEDVVALHDERYGDDADPETETATETPSD